MVKIIWDSTTGLFTFKCVKCNFESEDYQYYDYAANAAGAHRKEHNNDQLSLFDQIGTDAAPDRNND